MSKRPNLGGFFVHERKTPRPPAINNINQVARNPKIAGELSGNEKRASGFLPMLRVAAKTTILAKAMVMYRNLVRPMARFNAVNEGPIVRKDQGFMNPATPSPEMAYR